jgi:hypothetical protein
VANDLDPISRVAAQLSRSTTKAKRSARESRPDPREEDAAAYREAYGKRPYGQRMRAAFYQFLPEAPRGRYVGRDDAARYVAEIDSVLERQQWTQREVETLRQLRVKWLARAKGKDARFLAMGNVGGLNDRYRRKGVADIICAIRDAIEDSAGRKPVYPSRKFVVDKGWAFGKPNPDRRSDG